MENGAPAFDVTVTSRSLLLLVLAGVLNLPRQSPGRQLPTYLPLNIVVYPKYPFSNEMSTYIVGNTGRFIRVPIVF